VLKRMSGFVSHDASELVTRAAFNIEHLTALQPNEAGMCEIERDGEPGHTEGGKPFLGEPDVWAESEAASLERFVESIDARCEPRPFYCKAEVLDTELEQSFGGPGRPRKSPVRWGHPVNV